MTHSSDASHPDPMMDAPRTLSDGTVLRVRNIVVFQGQHVRRLTIVIETPTAAGATGRLGAESRELAEMHQQFADDNRIDGITVMICRTQACLELRERSDEMFHFVRGLSGTWVADPAHPQ